MYDLSMLKKEQRDSCKIDMCRYDDDTIYFSYKGLHVECRVKPKLLLSPRKLAKHLRGVLKTLRETYHYLKCCQVNMEKVNFIFPNEEDPKFVHYSIESN